MCVGGTAYSMLVHAFLFQHSGGRQYGNCAVQLCEYNAILGKLLFRHLSTIRHMVHRCVGEQIHCCGFRCLNSMFHHPQHSTPAAPKRTKTSWQPTWISSHLMSFSTSVWLSSMNSSCWTTSEKCFWEKSSAACIRSRQLWVSAKSRIPRQLEGSSWLSKKSQHALFTPGG